MKSFHVLPQQRMLYVSEAMWERRILKKEGFTKLKEENLHINFGGTRMANDVRALGRGLTYVVPGDRLVYDGALADVVAKRLRSPI